MSGDEKIYENIITTLRFAIQNFWNEHGIEPNKIIMSDDIYYFILSHTKGLITCVVESDEKRIMGMDIENLHDKKGIIEVGIMKRIPYTINTEYTNERGIENG